MATVVNYCDLQLQATSPRLNTVSLPSTVTVTPADGSITPAKIASGASLVEVVASLPSSGNFAGRTVFLTTDSKLYRYTGTAWTKAIATVDLSGTIANTQIAAGTISGDRLQGNTITASQIASNTITAGQIATGTITADRMSVTSLSSMTTETGTLVVGTSGYVLGGQTGYNTGTGFFLGYSGTAYKLSIGSSSNALLWDGSALTVKGGSFTTGTGSTPSGAAFEVTNTGVLWADNLYVNHYLYSAGYSDSYPATQVSQSYNNCGVSSIVSSAQSGLSAHAIRGQNQYWNTSGLVGGATSFDFYAEGTAANYGPFTGAHDVLLDPSDPSAEGDIVVDVQCVARNGLSNTIFKVTRATAANQRAVIGVLVKRSGLLSNSYPPAAFGRVPGPPDGKGNPTTLPGKAYSDLGSTYDAGIVNALGEGQLYVCGEAGDIAAGDLIVASSTPGKGMRQSDDVVRSYTVARAREGVSFKNAGDIALIACIYLCG